MRKKNVAVKTLATVCGVLTAVTATPFAHAYSGHGSPFSGIDTPNYPKLGVTFSDIYTKGYAGAGGYGFPGGPLGLEDAYSYSMNSFNAQASDVQDAPPARRLGEYFFTLFSSSQHRSKHF